jgi:MarR family transcriptional regulator, transcriptional regulator for hemolysin
MVKEERPFRLGSLIHDVSRLRRTVVDKALRPLGVTRSQWWVLSSLSRYSREGMMQSELSRSMDVGKVTLGGLVDRLQAGGYVERRAVPGDRRAKCVVMTAKGTRLLAHIERVARVVNTEIMTGISASDKTRLEATLNRIKDRLIAMDAVPGSSGNSHDDEG